MSLGSSRRLRSRRACVSCRRRKRKCDGKIPCQSCTDYEYDCSYVGDQITSVTPEQAAWPVTSMESIRPLPCSLHSHDEPCGHGVREQTRSESTLGVSQVGVIEPWKLRFADASSAIAFPRMLSLSLGSDIHPRLHSFAFNVGIRQERFHIGGPRLTDILTLEEAIQYSEVFLRVVNPYFTVLEPQSWNKDVRKCLSADAGVYQHLSEVVCFTVALGSFFSWPHQLHCETELVQLGERLLNRSTFEAAPSLIQLHHARAWLLRTLYLRLMTRPNIAWLSSAMTMHVVESLGLHRELNTLVSGVSEAPVRSEEYLKHRRQLFWLAWSINRMISFEYGRSHVTIMGVTSHKVGGRGDNSLVQLYSLLYEDYGNTLITNTNHCATILEQLDNAESGDSFYNLVRAEIACGLHRKLYTVGHVMSQKHTRHLLAIAKRALEGARTLLISGQPWSIVVSVPFQLACSILALGSSESLDILPDCLNVLQEVDKLFSSHLTREAHDTARVLTRIASQAKEGQLKALHNALMKQSTQESGLSLDLDSIDWTAYWNQEFLDLE